MSYSTYDVTLVLTEDEPMKQLNRESRGIDTPTDILSFPFQDVIIEPGILDEPDFDFPDYYNLGDLFIDVPYVIRRCKQDQEDNEDYSTLDETDRGVSGAMSTVYNPEDRIQMLLVHGMLHLVGYDHIEDTDYELMVTKEEEILKKLSMMEKMKKNTHL
jgi:probable rRNA maturation factor